MPGDERRLSVIVAATLFLSPLSDMVFPDDFSGLGDKYKEACEKAVELAKVASIEMVS